MATVEKRPIRSPVIRGLIALEEAERKAAKKKPEPATEMRVVSSPVKRDADGRLGQDLRVETRKRPAAKKAPARKGKK